MSYSSIGIKKELSNDSPVSALHGVGDVRKKAYERLGIVTLNDMVMHFPRSYENRGDIRPLVLAAESPERSAVLLTVATEPKATMIRRGMTLVKFRAFDESASCEITFFNQNYLKTAFKVGETYRFYGKVEIKGKRTRTYSMSSPAYEEYREGRELPPLVPVYPLCEGITQKQIRQNMEAALSVAACKIPDTLPDGVMLKNRLCTLAAALRGIHSPESYAELSMAKRRLIFEECFNFALAMRMTSAKQVIHGAPRLTNSDVSEFLNILPYRLTNAQQRVIDEIANDIKKDIPMSRILVGDVGCGKTACAAAAMYIAVKSGKRAAIMAPTEILAVQHYNDLRAMFSELGIDCALLVGSLTQSEKRRAREEIADQSGAEIIVGTHALLTEDVELSNVGLVVVDEQHRFGVNQRACLSEKTKNAHMLVMSATPIPRTLALTLYGDLDVSRIDEMPNGRQTVDTFLVDEGYRERLDAFIKKQVDEGGQVYIVCPSVDEKSDDEGDLELFDVPESLLSDKLISAPQSPPLKSAVKYSKELKERLPSLRIEFIHGKMKPSDKDSVMREFVNGNINVLVSTTVIEVGVNVPNASLMIVENAERFGLSQLHQLRGRVGRGTRRSYCVLVSDSKTQTARERLSTMCKTHDGYEIAEEDLRLRGPGDFLRSASGDSMRQSGGLDLGIAKFCEDTSLMTSAFAAATELASSDPELLSYPLLLEKIRRLYKLNSSTIN